MESNNNNTIFDDIFRTTLEKIPQLIIPLVNEVYGTSYPMNTPVTQYHNEFHTLRGEKITDSHLGVNQQRYHIECQSTSDSHIHIRMLEYDTAIGIETLTSTAEQDHMYYPHSCILFLRGTQAVKTKQITIHFPNGTSILYTPSVIYLQRYSLEEIFQKRLLFLLPFYIIKYEKEKLTLTDNPSRLQTLLDEYTFMKQSLNHEPLFYEHDELYRYMIDLINRTINYIFAGNEPVRKGLSDIMGGKVLELETDRIIQKATDAERENGIRIMISISQEDKIPPEKILHRLCTNYNLSQSRAEEYIKKYSQV